MADLLITALSGSPRFELDGLVSEGSDYEADVPTRPLESGASAADFVIVKPRKWKAEGILTFSPDTGLPGPARATAARDTLAGLLRARQPVLWTTPLDSATVLLTKISPEASAEEGLKIKLSIEATEYLSVTPSLTLMPASKLKPSAKPGSTKPTSGESGKRQVGSSYLSKARFAATGRQ